MKCTHLLSKLFFLSGIILFSTSLFAQDYKIPETGQVSCYDEDGNTIDSPLPGDSLYGQDAQYTRFEISLTDNGDGTVTDHVTGLTWQQVPSSNTFTWQEAIDHCDDLVFAGYDDWRTPSAKELFSISNFNSGWPYLNTDFFTLASGIITKDEQYWTSNHYVGVTVEGGSDAAFGVNHVTGHIKAYPANATGPIGGKYVRAVRGETFGENDFVDNGDATITDNSTALMWMQNDSGEGINWKVALAYAETSEFAGYDDWRLPNVKELQSIVDYSYSPSATNPDEVGPAIDPIFNCTPIINEAGDDDYAYYWTSTSALFQANMPYYYAWYVAFGMAVNGEGEDFHGAGGVRFDTKYEGGPLGEGGERYYNYVRLVRNTTETGVYESSLNNSSLNMYPNPATDQLTLSDEYNIVSVSIYSISGQLIIEASPNSNRYTVDVSDLKNGFYIVKATNEKGIVNSKSVFKE